MAGDPRFGRGRSRFESSRSHALAGKPRSAARAERAARSRFRRPRVEQLERRELLATLPVMLKDLSPDAGSSVVNQADVGHRVVEMDGLYYFAATTPATGLELWRTDGTPENTEIVVDLVEGPADGVLGVKTLWIGPDGNLYFAGATQQIGLQRLRPGSSTPEHVASVNVPDLNPVAGSLQGAIFNGTLYYPAGFLNAQNQPIDIEFAKFNFTTGQAELVHDVAPGLQSSFPSQFTVAGDNLFFLANSDVNPAPELWRFDGVQTTWVSSLGIAQGEPVKLVAAEDRLYVMVDGSNLDRLWSVQPDGQTRELLQAPILMPNTMQALGNDVIFGAYEESAGYHVVRTTSGGLDTEFVMLGLGNIADQRGVAHVMDGIYYFFATGTEALGDLTTRYLWRSDGTFAGTYRVTTAGVLGNPTGAEMTSTDGMLYFLAHHPTQGFGLWQSDGTGAGTEFVMATNAGSPAPVLLPPVAIDGKVFFAADDGVHGRETWFLGTPDPPPPPKLPDLVASGLRIIGSTEVKWGEALQIAFDVTSRDAAVDGFQVQVVLSGDPLIDTTTTGDYLLGIPFDGLGLAADETVSVQMFLSVPGTLPPPSFQVTGRLYIGLQVDPLDEHEESDETNNVNQGLGVDTILARDVPEVMQVVTHGIDPNFDVSSGFNGRWQWDYPRKLWDLAASTSLAGKTGTYSTIWNSSVGWTRALLDVVAQAWLKTPDAVELPPEALAELQRYSEADLQFALERAVREVEFTAHKIVQELHIRGDLIGPGAQQKIHLIGMGSGAAVNARVAQLLTDRGYTITLFTALDGLGTDWPGAAADLTDVSLNNVPADRRINYRVQSALEDPLVPTGTTSGIEQLASKLLAKLLGRPIDPELIPDAFDEWRAPMRSSPYQNVNLAGPSPDEPTNHFNIADRYFNHGSAAAELDWLATVPPPTPRPPVPSAVSPLLDDFIDGSFERIPALAAMIDSLEPFAAADEFTKAWLEAVNLYAPLVGNDWFTFNDATIAPHGEGHALRLTQSMEFAATNARQSVMVPPNSLLTFSLEAFGTLDSNDFFSVTFEAGSVHSTVYSGRLMTAGVVGPHAISLAPFAGKVGTFSFYVTGSLNNANTVMVDNLQIRTGGHIGSASAELLPGSDTVALEASDILALPGGIDQVRYYVETNGLIGLQIGSDRLLGAATDPADDWRLESPAYGLKYGYERLYAVAWKGGTAGPERSIDLFLNPPAVTPYHRADAPLDVNGDGEIEPIDALIVINALNAGLTGDLAAPERITFPFDTTANNSLEPIDALLIINHLNAQLFGPGVGAEAAGEGEGSAATPESAEPAEDQDAISEHDAALLALLDLDPREKRSRRQA